MEESTGHEEKLNDGDMLDDEGGNFAQTPTEQAAARRRMKRSTTSRVALAGDDRAQSMSSPSLVPEPVTITFICHQALADRAADVPKSSNYILTTVYDKDGSSP
ncbi:hypothetical protein FOFC_02656 [Fusarium oxysporum]|nr:hypothetical protein FOFC_02656 [Fusarium oxysporum]